MLSDLRFALRQLRKSPGFSFVALLTLALGIGANTAIFSFFNTLLLAPLPYPESGRIVQVFEAPNTGGLAPTCGGVFMDWQDRATQFEALALLATEDKNLTGAGVPVRVGGASVSAEYLKVLGVRPARGRDFTAAEDAPGGNRNVIIVSHEFCQRQWGGNSAALGRILRLDGQAYEVIGVLPPRALLMTNLDYLIPATVRADAWKQSREFNFVCAVVGRLKPGATLEQAIAELNAVKQSLNSQYPSFKQPWAVTAQPLQEALFGSTRPYVAVLLAAVALVLLVGCANVASLLLARGAARQTEIAVRCALGASRGRIVRLLLAESAVLAFAGGVLGTVLGAFLVEPISRLTGIDTLPGLPVGIDGRVLAFTFGVSVLTALLAGLVPAWGVSRASLLGDLKESSRGSSRGRHRLQSLLIITETALTVVLLVSAGLLLRSFGKALRADPGFRPDHVIAFDLSRAHSASPTTDARTEFTRRVIERLEQIPGVARAAMVSSLPMNGSNYFGDLISREDRPETRNDLNAGFDAVAGDYFATMGIPLLRGRLFNEVEKTEAGPKVVVVSQSLARRLFGDEEALGRFLHRKDEVFEVIGIVGDIRRFQLDLEPAPHVYYPQVRFPWATTIVVRTEVPPLPLADSLRRAVLELDPEQPIANVRTLEGVVANSLHSRTIMLTLLGIFAVTALALACLGLYGVMSYAVAQRTREMGIRLALGADHHSVIRLILRDGLTLVGCGLFAGALGSVGAGLVLANQLFEARTADPLLVLGAVALALAAVSLVACWLPARRATRVDPLVALRAE